MNINVTQYNLLVTVYNTEYDCGVYLIANKTTRDVLPPSHTRTPYYQHRGI